ncbi:hypothetical protein F4604DRAFT_1932094 [Suillus subluteus]|nr:hypothetical protein F4604DRAFT_1932094 [Suillus subluteus]
MTIPNLSRVPSKVEISHPPPLLYLRLVEALVWWLKPTQIQTHHTISGDVLQKPEGWKNQATKGKKAEIHISLPYKQSQNDNVVQLLGATISAINATKDLVPINLAKGILGTIANILTIAQSVIKNKSDFQVIANKCKTIREILERVTKGATKDNLQGYLGHALTQLNKSVSRINSNIESLKEGFLHWLLSVTIDRDRITRWEKDLDQALVLFRTEVITGITIRVEKLSLGPGDDARGINDTQYRPPTPPSRPSMFYGHGDLVAELTNLGHIAVTYLRITWVNGHA